VDKFVLRCSKELNLNANSLILLIYLLNQKNKDIFDYKKILDDLNFNETELLESISVLKEKKILSIIMEKNESGILEEHIDISSFYNIMLSRILDEEKNETNKQNIYDSFEKEFGRTLSPMEYEIITNWTERNYGEELILLALKEAVYNHVSSLSYVDRILQDWKKKGIKNKEVPYLFAGLGWLSAYAPWVMVTRLCFIYHYFPCAVFGIVAMALAAKDICTAKPQTKKAVGFYLALCLVLFVIFLPVTTGVPASREYLDFLEFLPQWHFVNL
jgi:DNA replication protein